MILDEKQAKSSLLDDGRSDCVHIGFAYSLPELYGIISSKGIKVPNLAHMR